MSKDLNKVQLIGRLAQDPEGRYTQQGTPITTFTVATGRTFKDSESNQREETEWTKIACWGKLAELAQEYLRKGARVYVEGRLQTRSWEDQESGQKRYMTEVVANDIIFLDRRQDGPAPEGEDELAESPPARPAPAAQPVRGAAPRARMATTPAVDDIDDELPFSCYGCGSVPANELCSTSQCASDSDLWSTTVTHPSRWQKRWAMAAMRS